MVVQVHFILHVQEDQREQNEKQHEGHVKGEECDERPDLEQNYQLELNGIARELHPLV